MRKLAVLIVLALMTVACSLTAAPTATPVIPTVPPSPTITRPPAATLAPTATAPATVVPTETPIPPVRLIQLPHGSLTHPLDAVLIGQTVYAIDSGKLKAIEMASGALRVIAPADGIVDKHPIQDLASLAYSDASKALYLLDRSGAVYGWDMAARWWLEREAGNDSDVSQEYPVSLAADSNGVYLLDTNNGSIWRRTDAGWKTLITSPQLEDGIQMVADGDLFILVGERPKQPARLLRLHGASLSAIDVQGGMEAPTRLELGPPEGRLLLVDQGLRRVRVIRQDNGSDYDGAMRLTLADAASEVHALAYGSEGIVFLGRDYLYKAPAASRLLAQPLTAGAIPAPSASGSPNDVMMLARLPALRMPIAGAHLPDIDRSLPGAPRPYRFGIHEGTDMYASTVGVNVVKRTQVLAAADGMVIRADVDYREASVAQVNAWLDESMVARMTSPDIQNKLGGRQVWIDHGNGLSTRYLHLSGIASGIQVGSVVKAGALIGYAGNSGTTEAAAGSDSGIHLHFEIRVGNGYFGQWLSPIETRRLLEQLLALE